MIEIADGLLQRETAALLQAPSFRNSVDAWVLAAGDALGAFGALQILRGWHIEPLAISGLLSLSPLSMRETIAATGLECLTAKELQSGRLNDRIFRAVHMNGSSIDRTRHSAERLMSE